MQVGQSGARTKPQRPRHSRHDPGDAGEAHARGSRERQKLLGLKTKGTNRASDDCRVADLVFKGKSRRFKMIGVPDDEAFIDKEDKDLPEVVNDLDFDYMPEEASNALADRSPQENARHGGGPENQFD